MVSSQSNSDASPRPLNYILGKMPEEQFGALSRFLIPTDLPLGMQLSTPSKPLDYVFFPVSGLISVGALTQKGESVEVAVIGREGLAGVCVLLGQSQMGHSVVMQRAGSGFRIRSAIVCDEFRKGGDFAELIHSFVYMQMLQMSQSVLCNRLHSIEMRIARWMLTACDRTQTTSLQITQEFLAQILGSRRSTVTVAAGQMQRDGLIDYSRGRVRIVNRVGLEALSCNCYTIIRQTYDKLIGRDF